METDNKRIIEERVAGKHFTLAGISNSIHSRVKKIYIADHLPGKWASQDLPETEIVENAHAILNDHEIDLVLMPEAEKNNLEMVSHILQSGKNLRIV